MSSQAAMLASLCCGNVCSNAKAPQSQPAGPRAPDAGLGHPQRPPAARRAGASSRHLADHLRIARNTVVFAYQQLVSEGYLVSRERSGHFVSDSVMQGHLQNPAQGHGAPATTTAADDAQRPRAGTSGCARPSLQRNIVKPRDWRNNPYPSSMASSTKTCFPPPNGASAVSRRCRCWTSAAGAGPHHPTTALIEQIRTQVLPRRGRLGRRVEIVITVGAQHALYLLADLLVNDDTVVGMEDPYPDARNIFASHTRHLLPLPVDEHGLITGTQLLGCDYLFVTPGHQCPTSVTLSRERRDSLLPWPARPTA